jgi:hypothetical protein
VARRPLQGEAGAGERVTGVTRKEGGPAGVHDYTLCYPDEFDVSAVRSFEFVAEDAATSVATLKNVIIYL